MTPTCCSTPPKQGTLRTSCCGFGKSQPRCAIGQRQSTFRAASKCASYSEGARACHVRLVSACVCSRASQKVSILVLGPWCGAKTPRWKLARAASLDAAFLSSDKGGEHRTSSWSRYVSLADCAAAEYKSWTAHTSLIGVRPTS